MASFATIDHHPPKRKIIDCFTFYNELDMLEYRLGILYDTVDYFVLVEAKLTHSGKKKPTPSYYLDHFHRFEKYANKIIHVLLEEDEFISSPDISKGEQWINENRQRLAIQQGIDRVSPQLKDDDLLVIADVDEIPNPEIYRIFAQRVDGSDAFFQDGVNLSMDFYYYDLNYKNKGAWTHPKMVTYGYYKTTDPQKIRFMGFDNTIDKAGWHLSYFGDEVFIQTKIRNFAHQEYNHERYTNLDIIRQRMRNKTDLFDRYAERWEFVPIEKNGFLPPNCGDKEHPMFPYHNVV